MKPKVGEVWEWSTVSAYGKPMSFLVLITIVEISGFPKGIILDFCGARKDYNEEGMLLDEWTFNVDGLIRRIREAENEVS